MNVKGHKIFEISIPSLKKGLPQVCQGVMTPLALKILLRYRLSLSVKLNSKFFFQDMTVIIHRWFIIKTC